MIISNRIRGSTTIVFDDSELHAIEAIIKIQPVILRELCGRIYVSKRGWIYIEEILARISKEITEYFKEVEEIKAIHEELKSKNKPIKGASK